ncbi:hypothetical protein A6035_13940 [Dietzia lutea]|uniref:Uncharacterized protein n=1 Tax=Dietzia lutea TaxID=546160 RepID=A0A2S1RA38_9ACTN|nr:hypothetical protein A6035_13940 [Dietzia lutea]
MVLMIPSRVFDVSIKPGAIHILFGPHLVDEFADHRQRRSSSPAKKIEARRMFSGFSVSRRFSALLGRFTNNMRATPPRSSR